MTSQYTKKDHCLTALKVMNADGSSVQTIVSASGAPDDLALGDPAWSSDDWIVFVVAQNNTSGTCFKLLLFRSS